MFDHVKIIRLAWAAVLALLIQGVLGGVSESVAAESAPVVSPRANAQEQEQKTLKETIDKIEKGVDKTHDTLEQDILYQVKRFDNFFGIVPESDQKTSYELRWRSGIRLEEGGKVKPGMTLWANIVLPKTSEKLRLFISGVNQLEPLAPALPDDPGNPGFDRAARPTARIVNTEFRYRIMATEDQDLFVGTGVKVALPLEPFARTRYQVSHKFSNIFLIRVGETLFIKYNKGVGETTEVNLEKALDKKTMLRLSNSATFSQEFHGLEWGSELSWIRELSVKSAITFTGGVYGNSYPSTVINNYRLLTRYRRNFLRDWLYYELEPEISWPRNTDGTRSPKYAMTFRLEILFRKAEQKN